MKKNLFISFGALATPLITFAQISNGDKLLQFFASLINALLPLIISAGVLVILWGILRYIQSGDNPEERSKARAFMVNGVISLFVMVSIWGFVNVLVNTFNLDSNIVPDAPSLPQPTF